MKLLKQTTVVFCTLLVLFLSVATVYDIKNRQYKDHYVLSNKSLRIINSHDIIIDDSFFMMGGSAQYVVMRQLMPLIFDNKLKEVLGTHDSSIRIAFMSGGGMVSIYDTAMGFKEIKKAYIICTIGSAQSVAFTYMMQICDERIILPNAELMTHPVYNGNNTRTDGTRSITVKHSDGEAKILKIDRDKWYDISRNQGDKYYTPDEMIKYGIDTQATGIQEVSTPNVKIKQ